MPRQRDGIGRRGFLALVGTMGAAGVGLIVGWQRYARAQDALFLRLARAVGVSRDIRALGREYLSGHPEEASRDALLRGLRADLDGTPFGFTDQDLRVYCRKRIQQDFHDRHVVTVQGWVLSRTELRLSALAAVLVDEA